MTQRIFDTDNKQDMQDLWDILPDFITSVYQKKESVTSISNWVQRDDGAAYPLNFISIFWHDKTEIIRPIQEATEQDIGKICRFWNYEESYIGMLVGITNMGCTTYYVMDSNEYADLEFLHCRRLTKQEIEELC